MASDPPHRNDTRAAARDVVIDNGRALLIGLVVLGHLLESFPHPAARIVTIWIYGFHMPAFVFLAGYLARSFTADRRRAGRLVTQLVVPYLIFQVVHRLLAIALLDRDVEFQFLRPTWTLWFLLSLLAWRLLVPVFRALRWPVATTVLVSVLAPLMANLDQTFSLARTLSFAPFFVAGLVVTPHHLQLLRRRWVQVAGVVVLAGGLLASVALRDHTRLGFFTFATSYAARDWEPAMGMTVRVLALCCGAAGTAAVLALAPATRRWWTFVGERTMYVYLLHAVALWGVRNLGWAESWDTLGHVALAVVVAGALTLVLASRPVGALTRWLVEPPAAQLLVRREDGGRVV